MKNIKKVGLLLLIVLLQGCNLDPYRHGKYAESAIDEWFSYQEGEKDLGKVRRNQESISEILNRTCSYVTNDNKNHYIYSCKIEYKPIGETVIPLSKNKTVTVYVALTFKEDRSYSYIVYHSSSKENIWLYDEELSFEK